MVFPSRTVECPVDDRAELVIHDILNNSANFNVNTIASYGEQDPNELSGEQITTIKNNQRRFLLVISMGVPLLKFVLACFIIGSMAYYDRIGNELLHPSKDGHIQHYEAIYIPVLSYIPMSVLSIMIGYFTFSKYPNVTDTTIRQFLLYATLVLLVQVGVIIALVATLELTLLEHLITHALTIGEAYCLMIIRCCYKRRFTGFHDPRAMELIRLANNRRLSNDENAPSTFQLPINNSGV